MSLLQQQLTEIQRLPSSKRKEENHKFLFKRFFKFLQNGLENPEEVFQKITEKFLLGEFTQEEISHYFKPTKEIRLASSPQTFKKNCYFIPFKLNNDFLNRILKIDLLRNELDFYMTKILPEQAKEEIKTKTLKFMSQFKEIYLHSRNYEIFSDAIMNCAIDCNHKNIWSLGEINSIIIEMKNRMKKMESIKRVID